MVMALSTDPSLTVESPKCRPSALKGSEIGRKFALVSWTSSGVIPASTR